MKAKFYRHLLYYLFIFCLKTLALLPRSLIHGICSFFGFLTYYLLLRERKRVLDHLDIAFGSSYSPSEKKRISRDVFVHFGLVLGDMLKMMRLTPEEILEWVEVSPEVRKRFEEAHKEQGFIVSTAHLGNWELLASYLNHDLNKDKPSVVVARRIYFEKYNQVLVKLRERFGVQTVYRDEPFRQIVKYLKEGCGIGVLVDHDVGSIPGIFVNFFGKPAYTTDSVARLAYLSNAPITPFFMIRKGKKYELVLDEILRFNPKADKEQEIIRITESYTGIIEKMIRKYPEQWGWMHRRWRTKPEEVKDKTPLKEVTT